MTKTMVEHEMCHSDITGTGHSRDVPEPSARLQLMCSAIGRRRQNEGDARYYVEPEE